MLKKVLLLLCLSAQLIMNGQWKRVGGPNIGSVQEIFNSGSTLILYTINAGIFTSQDDGISWQESTSGLPCNHGVSAMAEGAGVLYAAINQGGIYVSLDQGKTWEARNDGIENLTFYSLEVDNDHVYAGNDAGGIYYSENQGLHWENRSDGISTVRVVDILSHDTELYIASKEVFRSNDQGESWSQVVIPDLNPNGIRALLEHDGIFYASTEGAIYVSDDNMASWTKKNIAISGATINNLSSNGNKVFATTSNGRYMVSEDGGNTWSIEENPLTNRAVNHLFVWQGKYLLSTNDGLFSSSNNGMTWNPRTGDLNAAQIVSLFVNEEFVFAGTDVNGMFRYQKDTGLWTEINTGLDALNSYRVDDILFVNGELMIATGGGIYTSQDWGASWNRRFDPGINRSTQVLAENKGILITAVNGEGLYLSNDSGNTWTKTNNMDWLSILVIPASFFTRSL